MSISIDIATNVPSMLNLALYWGVCNAKNSYEFISYYLCPEQLDLKQDN